MKKTFNQSTRDKQVAFLTRSMEAESTSSFLYTVKETRLMTTLEVFTKAQEVIDFLNKNPETSLFVTYGKRKSVQNGYFK